MLLHSLARPVSDAFIPLIDRRVSSEPIAYIVGTRDFWTLTLSVTPDVLIPRPDTETLIEAAVERVAPEAAPRMLDLGTGSGALLLAGLRSEEHTSELKSLMSTSYAVLCSKKNNLTHLKLSPHYP